MSKIIEKNTYWSNGKLRKKTYLLNGLFHHSKKPCLLYYSEDGKILYKEYRMNGKRHNANGPAYVEYDVDGHIRYKEYCYKDKVLKNIKTNKELKLYIKTLCLK